MKYNKYSWIRKCLNRIQKNIWIYLAVIYGLMCEMVKTRAGNSTTMELSDDFVKYLDSRFDQLLMRLATKDDVTDMKNDVSTLLKRVEEQCDKIDLLNSQVAKQGERIDVLEARVAMLESHVRQKVIFFHSILNESSLSK